jgi:hypothetical protein
LFIGGRKSVLLLVFVAGAYQTLYASYIELRSIARCFCVMMRLYKSVKVEWLVSLFVVEMFYFFPLSIFLYGPKTKSDWFTSYRKDINSVFFFSQKVAPDRMACLFNISRIFLYNIATNL